MWWQKLLWCSIMLCLEVGNFTGFPVIAYSCYFQMFLPLSLIFRSSSKLLCYVVLFGLNFIIVFEKIDSMIDNKMPLNSMDGKYILTGGEDDLVQVWSMEDRKVVAWGEGHNSWVSFLLNNARVVMDSYMIITILLIVTKSCWQVSGVAFDSYWSSPNSEGTGETVMYRFGSVGQVLRNIVDVIAMVVPSYKC
jgi:hypothetical protein